MNGSESDAGVIHRAVKDVFEKIHMVNSCLGLEVNMQSLKLLDKTFNSIFLLCDQTSDREFLIRVSYMEIYNEEINDLFAVENNKLPIHESLEVAMLYTISYIFSFFFETFENRTDRALSLAWDICCRSQGGNCH